MLTTEEAVRAYLKKHMPIEDQNLTLLKLANRVKKEYPLTVKPKTIMSHLNKVLQSDYNMTWDQLQLKLLLKYGTECDIYLILSTGFSNNTYHYYLKVGESTCWAKQRRSSYLSHNPGANVVNVCTYKGAFTPEAAEVEVRRFIWNILDIKVDDIVDGTVEWVEISKEQYLYFEEHGADILKEALKFIPEIVPDEQISPDRKVLKDFDNKEEAKKYFKETLNKRNSDFPKSLKAYSDLHPEIQSPVTYYDFIKAEKVINKHFDKIEKEKNIS